jgi:uncharacterized SAM-binding protein YcdF (DUF218 family)
VIAKLAGPKASIATGVVFLALAAVFIPLMLAIDRQSRLDEASEADVIIVMGAAEYRGRPSPVFKARLDHAFELWQRKLAPRILTTGGAGGDPDFTEGGVGRSYLISRGVPADALIVEPEAESTAQSVIAIREIMIRMDLNSCILVSDGYHVFRAKRMLEHRGVEVYGSPRPGVPSNSIARWWTYARQAAAYLIWTAGLAT